MNFLFYYVMAKGEISIIVLSTWFGWTRNSINQRISNMVYHICFWRTIGLFGYLLCFTNLCYTLFLLCELLHHPLFGVVVNLLTLLFLIVSCYFASLSLSFFKKKKNIYIRREKNFLYSFFCFGSVCEHDVLFL